MNDANWRIWNYDEGYGELLYKRATGKLAEMESAKALCKVISGFYQRGMKLADVGCGAGHYLRSLRTRIDKDIDYTGIDATDYYIALAKKAFPHNAKFQVGDVLKLPFDNDSFDVVMCNNLILHLPPPPQKAIDELIRISSKYIVIRTVFGERNYIVKELRHKNEAGHGDPNETAVSTSTLPLENFTYFNMYTEEYLRSVIQSINSHSDIKIIADEMWKAFDNRELRTQTGTRVMADYQVSGNLLLSWKFIVIKKQ